MFCKCIKMYIFKADNGTMFAAFNCFLLLILFSFNVKRNLGRIEISSYSLLENLCNLLGFF